MSAVGIAVNRIFGIAEIMAIVGDDGVFVDEAPEDRAPPYLIVSLAAEHDEPILEGSSGYYESRVTITAIGLSPAITHRLGELIKKLFPCVKQTIATDDESPGGFARDVDIAKDGADVSDSSSERTDGAQPTFRRMADYSVTWR